MGRNPGGQRVGSLLLVVCPFLPRTRYTGSWGPKTAPKTKGSENGPKLSYAPKQGKDATPFGVPKDTFWDRFDPVVLRHGLTPKGLDMAHFGTEKGSKDG